MSALFSYRTNTQTLIRRGLTELRTKVDTAPNFAKGMKRKFKIGTLSRSFAVRCDEDIADGKAICSNATLT